MYFFFHAGGVSSFIGEGGVRDDRMYFFSTLVFLFS